MQIEVSNDELLGALSSVLSQLDDKSSLMDAIGLRLETQVRLRFESMTDPSGNRWAPHAASTSKRYAKLDATKHGVMHRGSLLNRTGRLLDSLSYAVGQDSVSIGFSALSDGGDPYAQFHEFGTKHMPRREILMGNPESGSLGRDDEEAIIETAKEWIFRNLP